MTVFLAAPDRGSRQAVEMRGVALAVGGPDGGDRRILGGVDLEVPPGGTLNLVGPSGSGKSSLLRLVNGLEEAAEGVVRVLGRPVSEWPVRELRRRAALVPQEPSLLGMSVRENLRLPFVLRGESPPDLEERVVSALRRAGLDPEAFLDRDDRQMSVGQKQRVTLARSLVTDPDILLLDEPTSALDPRTAEGLLDRVAAIREERGMTLVVVTHRLEEARRLGGRLAVLLDGEIAAVGPVEEVVDDPKSERVRRFLEGDGGDAAPGSGGRVA